MGEKEVEKERNIKSLEIVSFGNQTREDRRFLKKFVDFHWDHYRNDPQYIPLLDYEYLGFKVLGIHGFFEPDSLFLRHGEMRFFLAYQNGKPVARCNVFVNYNYNKHWKDKVGFFGQFESIDDVEVCQKLLDTAGAWLRERGMEVMRGPQNLPVNEATPGILTQGFDSRPVIYYHYNKPYYERLLLSTGFHPVKRVLSWEVQVQTPMEEKLARLAERVIRRYGITIEPWGKRPLEVRKREMLEVYNSAWSDNFGFVPFEPEEFYQIIDDMQLIMDKDLFLFVYVKGELAAFFGAVPNVAETLKPIPWLRRAELLRALKMLLGKNRTQGLRLGYLGVKKKFRGLGLDGVMLWYQKKYVQKHRKRLKYADVGWVLEDNVRVIRMVDYMNAKPSKTYTIFEKNLI